jgi:hypothetical protein
VQCRALKAYITSWTESQDPKKKKKQGVCHLHCGLVAIYIKKLSILKAREEELTETQIIFHHAKI